MLTRKLLDFVTVALMITVKRCLSDEHLEFLNFTWNVGMLQVPNRYGPETSGQLVAENATIWNAEIWHGRAFLCFPRWSKGVAATLVSTKWSRHASFDPPVLSPFPNWSMQNPGHDCFGFQSVTAAVVDLWIRLWVLDAGDIEIGCPPKFVIFDLVMGGKSGKEVVRHVIRLRGVNGRTLRSMVIDWQAATLGRGPSAYVSDPGGGDLLVYSLKDLKCWRLETSINGGVGSITISFPNSLLYLTSEAESQKLYSVNLKNLRYSAPKCNFTKSIHVSYVGDLLGRSSGLAADSHGGLLYFLRTEHAVLRWNTSEPLVAESHDVLYQDADTMPKVPHIIFDTRKAAWILANGFPQITNVSLMFIKVYDPWS